MLVCALRFKQRTCKHTDKTESAQIIRMIWACLPYSKSNQAALKTKSFNLEWALFAVRFSGHAAKFGIVCYTQKQPCQIINSFICVPFFAYAIMEKCAHLAQIIPCRDNWPSMDLTPIKKSPCLDSDMPKLDALQCFKPSEQIRPCAILQHLRNAITMSCILRFRALNALFRDLPLCAYAYMP